MTTIELVFACIIFGILMLGLIGIMVDTIISYCPKCRFWIEEEDEEENAETVIMEINDGWKQN